MPTGQKERIKKMKFNVSYKNENVYQSITVNAKDEATAKAFFEYKNPTAEFLGIKEATADDARPDKPQITAPADFEALPDDIDDIIAEDLTICDHCGVVIFGDHMTDGEMHLCEDCEDYYFMCEYCEKIHDRDFSIYCEDEDALYCENCAEDVLAWCEHCEAYHNSDNFVKVYTDIYNRNCEYWCEDCADRYATQCADCGEWYSGDLTRVANCDVVCDNCLENSYYYCEECGEWVYYTDYNTDAEMCDECAEARGSALIRQYHGNRKNDKKGECLPQWRNIWRGLGVELEIDREYSNAEAERATAEAIEEIAGDAIVMERDGSLKYGFEIITQPHTEAEFQKIDWRGIFDACIENGYTSHDAGTCGLHIHISREMFGTTEAEQRKSIAKLVYFYDKFYTDILNISRRDPEKAQQWASKYDIDTTDTKKAREHCEDIAKNPRGRYHAINLNNRATVEIRIMRGTLNLSSFFACVDFAIKTAKASRRVKWADINNAGKWLEKIEDNTARYIKNRGAFVGVV